MLVLDEKTGNPRIVTSRCRQGEKISLPDKRRWRSGRPAR
jgi:hypothetical protein